MGHKPQWSLRFSQETVMQTLNTFFHHLRKLASIHCIFCVILDLAVWIHFPSDCAKSYALCLESYFFKNEICGDYHMIFTALNIVFVPDQSCQVLDDAECSAMQFGIRFMRQLSTAVTGYSGDLIAVCVFERCTDSSSSSHMLFLCILA